MPSPTAASHAPTLRNNEEKNNSTFTVNQINISKTRLSRFNKSLNKSFFFLRRPITPNKMQKQKKIIMQRKDPKPKPKLINYPIPNDPQRCNS